MTRRMRRRLLIVGATMAAVVIAAGLALAAITPPCACEAPGVDSGAANPPSAIADIDTP
jgi:hypothetical protein